MEEDLKAFAERFVAMLKDLAEHGLPAVEAVDELIQAEEDTNEINKLDEGLAQLESLLELAAQG